MRIRKKKNLESRLQNALNSGMLYISKSDDRNFNTAILKKDYINFNTWFSKNSPLELEIGCGKGKFSVEYAKQNPNINLIAVEKSSNVLVEAVEKAIEENVTNLKFILCGAEYLERYIKEHTINKIYLNFSCPFQKNSYACHRLTNSSFLEIYKNLLKSDGEIDQKTDNMHFFEYSIEQFSLCGYIIKNVSLDLHNSDFKDNIETEYEHKFASLGQPIFRLEAYIKNHGEAND